jgi:hypothetical protein
MVFEIKKHCICVFFKKTNYLCSRFEKNLIKRLRSLMDKTIDSDSVDMGSIPVEVTIYKITHCSSVGYFCLCGFRKAVLFKKPTYSI